MTKTSCILCEVAHGRAPGTIHYEDNDIAVFDNVLDWAPVMILFAPKEHISQNQLWQNKNLFHLPGYLLVVWLSHLLIVT